MRSIVLSQMIITRNNEEIEVEIDGYVEYEIDTCFGADADGNRGSKEIIVHEVSEISAIDPETGLNYQLSDQEIDAASSLLTSKFLEE